MIESCAIITTEANSVLRDIHDRMPVMWSHGWTVPTNKKEVLEWLQPCAEETLGAYPVAPLVNSRGE